MTPPSEGILYATELADRFFIVPADAELPEGDLTVVGLDGRPHRVDATAITVREVTREQAEAHLRTQIEHAFSATAGTLSAVLGLDAEKLPEAAAAALRALADAVEQPGGQPLGRRIDTLVAQLEREFSPLFGQDPEKAGEERRKGYERDARAAIADSLRAAGLKPLSHRPDER